jgi:hypothetical protein
MSDMDLKVCIEGRYGRWQAGMKIPELYRKEFEPLKTCDEQIMSVITGDVSNEEAKIVIKARKDAAKILAERLAKIIVSAMERNDTHNGYAK